METQVVQVRAIENVQRRGIFICGRHPDTGEPFVWTPQTVECAVPVSVLPELEASPWLEVKRLDLHMQASKRWEIATAADAEACKAEAHAKALRERADALLAEAEMASKLAGKAPAPEVKPAPTPYTDQLVAALPDSVRQAVAEQKLSIQRVREEMYGSQVSQAAVRAAPKPGGAFARERARADGIAK